MLKNTCAAVIVAVLTASGATAATWTFGADAEAFDNKANQNNAGNGELAIEGTFDQVYRDPDSPLFGAHIQDNIRLTASATNNGLSADPFMDSKSGGKIAGLGVCSTGFDTSISNNYGGESQCSTHYHTNGGTLTKKAGDDNLVDPEVLKLFFSDIGGNPLFVTIDELLIRDAKHNPVDTAIWISSDPTFDGPGDFYNVAGGKVQGLNNLAASTMFWFTSAGTNAGDEVYLETLTATAVPVPAALPLMLAGLGGLGWIGRRRKAAEA